MTRRVTKYGEQVLKTEAKEVADFDAALKELGKDLVETMYAENGLGLAAPQVGESKRVFAIDMRRRIDTENPCVFTIDGKTLPLDICMPLIAVNPEVEEVGEYVIVAEEGCLSFPGIYAEVERSEAVKMKYFDTDGNPHELYCEGLFARCVQHENDHLDGVCFVDLLRAKELFKIDGKLKKLRRQTRDFLKENK